MIIPLSLKMNGQEILKQCRYNLEILDSIGLTLNSKFNTYTNQVREYLEDISILLADKEELDELLSNENTIYHLEKCQDWVDFISFSNKIRVENLGNLQDFVSSLGFQIKKQKNILVIEELENPLPNKILCSKKYCLVPTDIGFNLHINDNIYLLPATNLVLVDEGVLVGSDQLIVYLNDEFKSELPLGYKINLFNIKEGILVNIRSSIHFDQFLIIN